MNKAIFLISRFGKNKRLLWVGVLFFAFSLFCLIGCKKEDAQPPGLEILQPLQVHATADSTLRVTGNATDDQGLSQIRATLFSTLDGQSFGGKVLNVSGIRTSFQLEVRLGNRYTPAGDYFLRITASDLFGNEDSKDIPVRLEEFPLKKVWFFAGEEEGGGHRLWRMDTLGHWLAGPLMDSSFSDFQFDGNTQILICCSKNGDLTGYYPEDWGLAFHTWEAPFYPQSGFSSISIGPHELYLTFGQSPSLVTYSLDGTRQYGFPSSNLPIEHSLLIGTSLLTLARPVGMGHSVLQKFQTESGSLAAGQALDFIGYGIEKWDESHVAVLENGPSGGRIEVREMGGLGLGEFSDRIDSIFDLKGNGHGGHWWVEGNQIFFSGDNQIQGGAIFSGSQKSLDYDPTSGWVWTFLPNQLIGLDSTGQTQNSFSTPFGGISKIHIGWNK